MGYEPKFKLNKKDRKRWDELVLRDCVNVGSKHSRKYPPLSMDEKLELERLTRKQHRKLWRHPHMEPERRALRNSNRRLKRLWNKFKALTGNKAGSPQDAA